MFRFAPKKTVTLPVEFEDIFNDGKKARFNASFEYASRSEVKALLEQEDTDWEAITKERIKDWDIQDLECTEENVSAVMDHQHIAEAMVLACQTALLGRKKVQQIEALMHKFARDQLGN